jgi:hypothetical protein
VTNIPMAPEPCSNGVLAHLAGDPVPHPDLLRQLDDDEIGRLETVTISEEYL